MSAHTPSETFKAERTLAHLFSVLTSTVTKLARRNLPAGAVALGVMLAPRTSLADNPIIQTNYTADPAPMVHEGKLYLFTTHDEDVTVNDFFTMNDWRAYSSTDAVNWTDHGSPLHYNDFSWAGGNAWAGQVIYRNSKFYFYVPVVRTNGSNAIGVAVADNIIGPYEDAIGRPLITSDCGDIDPTVFIDDGGQAYLYWGNPNLCYVRLNEDMTSYQGSVTRVTMDTASFGTRSDDDRPTSYEEGPWFYARMGQYYMVYPGGPLPEHIAYSTAAGPTGPWTYRSVIMPAEGSSFTNHPGVVDYKGKSLFFYHNGALPGGGGYKRSVCVEEFTYGADGTIPRLRMTTAGAAAVDVLNPFARTEAETIAWETGIETERCSEGGMNVTSIDDGDYIKLKSVEFGAGATSLDIRVAAEAAGGVVELRLDSATGMVVGTCSVASTGSAEAWATQSCSVSGATGKHDLFLRFTRGGFKFNWWKFSGPGDPGTGGMGGQGGAAGSGQGGVAGMSGSPPTGGALTTGGNSGAGGAIATGGAAATGGTMTAGGISGAAGASSGTSASGAAGRPASGGTSTSGGQANTGGSSSDEGSCGCRVVGRGSKSSSLAAMMLLGLLWRRSSRRRRSVLSVTQ